MHLGQSEEREDGTKAEQQIKKPDFTRAGKEFGFDSKSNIFFKVLHRDVTDSINILGKLLCPACGEETGVGQEWNRMIH